MSTAVCGHNNPYTGGRHRPLVRRAIPVVLLLLVAGCLNTAPTHIRGIAFEPPEGVIEGDEIVFGVNPLAFPDRAVFYWELGDGAAVHGPQVTHTYAEEGTYTVRLTVVGPDGSAGTATREVVILHRNMPPVAHAGPGRNALVHASVAFDGSGSSDPEPELLAYAWDFGDDDTGSGEESGGEEVRVRKWFPETLYVNPAVITDDQGKATLGFPLADSITTWRVSALGSTKDGKLGGKDGSILVFQDFFIDVDFPAYLTRNDEITFPILVYNYLPHAQKVEIVLEEGEWFELYGPSSQEVVVEPDEITSVSFPVKVTTAGWHTLTVYGLGEMMSDAVAKVIQVKPDGKQFVDSKSGIITDQPIPIDLAFPDGYIENSQGLVVKLIPGIVAQIVEGMESMLTAPHG